jgi:hypothetical protein
MKKEEKEKTEYSPVARYYTAMDHMLYLSEDCSYRADRVDPFLTVLWHPHEERIVGIKLKGVRFLFERVKAIVGLSDSDFMPLVKALEVALTVTLVAETDAGELQKKYAGARKLAADVRVPSEEWGRAMAA